MYLPIGSHQDFGFAVVMGSKYLWGPRKFCKLLCETILFVYKIVQFPECMCFFVKFYSG